MRRIYITPLRYPLFALFGKDILTAAIVVFLCAYAIATEKSHGQPAEPVPIGVPRAVRICDLANPHCHYNPNCEAAAPADPRSKYGYTICFGQGQIPSPYSRLFPSTGR